MTPGGIGELGRQLRLLLAEDELLVAMDIEATLRALGYEVVGPVATVAEVEQLAASAELDGAVLDINLRGARVFPALPRLLARGLPVVLSSGYEGAAVLPTEFRHLPMLVKPYEASQLAAKLKELFGSRGPT
jgi:DNA-binding LytR/AlgR family response regulator